MHLRRTSRRSHRPALTAGPARRTLALAVGALLLAAPLSSCGFDYATDRVYTPATGVNDRSTDVDVLGAVIVSAQEGSGTFIASFSNNDQEKSATVDSLSGGAAEPGSTDASVQADSFDPIEVQPGGLVNLANDEQGIVVTGSFTAGDFVPVTVGFGNGEQVTLDVVVVPDDGYYAGLDRSSAGSSSESASPSESASESPSGGAEPAESSSPSASEAPSE